MTQSNKVDIKETSLVPCGYHVLVLPDPIEEATESGIIIKYNEPERMQASQTFGTLVAVGPIAWKDYGRVVFNDGSKEVVEGKPWAKVGDRVAYAKFGGSLVKDPVNGETYVLLNDQDIKLILK